MADDEYSLRQLQHVLIDSLRETAEYKFPPRKIEPKPLRGDYAAHAAGLLRQLDAALSAVPAPGADTRLQVEGLKPGALVEVATLPPAENSRTKVTKVPAALEFGQEDIVLLQSRRSSDRTESAVMFVPDSARGFLRGRIRAYGGRVLPDGNRPDIEKFEKIEKIQAATIRSLFVGDIDLAAPEAVWWEVWVRERGDWGEAIARSACAANLDVHADRLVFPDTTVVFIHASAGVLAAFLDRLPGAVSEVRRSTGTIEPFLDRGEGKIGQQDFVYDLVGRILPPPAGAPTVCVLDTGVSAEHPLIAPALHGNWAYDDAWGTDDHDPQGGHGTSVAALALYGDLEPLMNDKRNVVLEHAAESMKLLPPRGFPATKPPSYGVVTQGAVSKVEAARPHIRRSFCLANSATDFPPDRPSTWSGALDQIASGAMLGDKEDETPAAEAPKRLVLVATGNVQDGMREEVAPCQKLEDPAQSWNSLSVGGFTTKEQPPAPPPKLTPLVKANNRSPYSRGSQSLPYDLTPIKPEVLFEAGNMLVDGMGLCGYDPSVSLLSAGSDHITEPLVPFWATSAAVGVAGHFIGQLQAALPDCWPETLRALAVQSAEWPQPIRNHFIGKGAHWKTGAKSGSKSNKQRLLREFGYGVPDISRAVLSAKNDVTLLAQAEIQPFVLSADKRTAVFNEMHFYDLPWPKQALERLENEIVTMKITLSYFVEPNLTGKAATRPDTYRSFGLRFDMKKRSETHAHFRSRINAAQEKDGSETETEKSCWLLGPKAVQAGSLHCDLWRGRAIELASHDAIAVYPVGGWWKSHIGQRRMNDKGRYALAISISAQGHQVDLHSEVTNLVETKEIEALLG